MATEKILIVGSQGQIGLELTQELRNIYGNDNVIASDVKSPEHTSGPFEVLDVMDKNTLNDIFSKHKVTQVY